MDEIDRIFSGLQKLAEEKAPAEELDVIKSVLLLGEIFIRDIRRIADALENKKQK